METVNKVLPILKLDCSSDSFDRTIAYEILVALHRKGLIDSIYDAEFHNTKFRVSYKNGKRRKLKNFRVFYMAYKTYCKCCGPELIVDRNPKCLKLNSLKEFII